MITDPFIRFQPITVPGSVRTAVNDGSGSKSGSSGNGRVARQSPLSESEISMAIERLPPLPAVATKILEVVGSEGGSASDLENLVRLDPVITARLLKLVNSPYYGLPNRVSSISQAVTMIGFGGVRSLVVAASMSELMQNDMSVYGFVECGTWKNALACGSMAKAIAIETGINGDASEIFFLGGLMRDVGLLILGPELRRRQVTGLETAGSVTEQERGMTGIDHVSIGARLAEKWRLPIPIRHCIGEHHQPPETWPKESSRLIASVRLAERLTFASKIGLSAKHPFDAKIDPQLLQAAGLDVPRLQSLMKKLPGIIAAAEIPL